MITDSPTIANLLNTLSQDIQHIKGGDTRAIYAALINAFDTGFAASQTTIDTLKREVEVARKDRDIYRGQLMELQRTLTKFLETT